MGNFVDRQWKIMDGNQAAAYVAYAYSEAAAIYPITPSSPVAEQVDEWAASGRENLFGRPVLVEELQSEAGAAGALHGALLTGTLATTYTSSQGLLLMLPNLYRMAGELLPGVIYVAARSLSTHALSIFGDHMDIYACRQTGMAMLAASSVQEVMDLAPAAHRAALLGSLPFLFFYDGFRTSHEMEKIQVWGREDLESFLDGEALNIFRKRALHPARAKHMGTSQEANVYFQFREAANSHYDRLPQVVEECMQRINQRAGTDYHLFDYYGAPEAEHVMVAMGSVCETAEEAVDALTAQGEAVGLVKVRLYRPFSVAHFLAALPEGVRRISVLNRTKEPGAVGEPLYLDVVAALAGSPFAGVTVCNGRYGLSSKDTTPAQVRAVFANLEKREFTIGIEDDVTHLSLREMAFTKPEEAPGASLLECKFWGLGGDGTVGANKNSVKIIGSHTDLFVQAYFSYDSKKSRGLTVSHLRISEKPIRSAYLVQRPDFAACHNPMYMHKFDMVQEIRDGGSFLLNVSLTGEALEKWLPGQVKRYLAEHHIRFFVIDGMGIGKEIGLNNKINTILQAAFFRVSEILPQEEAVIRLKESVRASYYAKGEKIVEMNCEAIEKGMDRVRQVAVPDAWRQEMPLPLENALLPARRELADFVADIQQPIASGRGDALPVSVFVPYADGGTPSGSTAHERRNVALEVPVWKPENCIQCNRCSFVCPHAVIRPAVMTQEERAAAPADMPSLPMFGVEGHDFSIVISDVDCTGCGSCVGVCPGKQGQKALEMCPAGMHEEKQAWFDYGKSLLQKEAALAKFPEGSVKGSQLKKPYLEFHGACAGCGETTYPRLLTQLYGERMYIANATGCSSIWAASYPSTAYTVDEQGRGPAWAHSLFEDGAEFGYGMWMTQKVRREALRETGKNLLAALEKGAEGKPLPEGTAKLIAALRHWLTAYGDWQASGPAARRLEKELTEWSRADGQTAGGPGELEKLASALLAEKDFLPKFSQWVLGGDGWAYDIGFGGLDHILASGQDINVLVMDTEIYSNTGGQASKGTPEGAMAKFTGGAKTLPKKKLAAMAITYGYVYVAQIAMGADFDQTLRAIREAESYPGPSLLIAYSPCISHGIKAGMGSAQHEEAKAVESGYWQLFRFHPGRLGTEEGAFLLDSGEPTLDFAEFLAGELRFAALERSEGEEEESLFERAKKHAKERYAYWKRMEEFYRKNREL